jgi:hypothetical protein
VRVNELHVGNWCYRGGRDSCCFDYHGRRFTVRDGMLHIARPPTDDYPYHSADGKTYPATHDCGEPSMIEARFTVAPSAEACDVDATLFNDWRSAIVDGTLVQLYLLPGYPFTAPQLAFARERGFNAAVNRARIRALKSDTSATLFATAPPFV